MIAPKENPAFTLIELIIVVSIITVLTSVVLVDFNNGKRRQELGVVSDQALAMLQQAHADVVSGKVRSDEDGRVFLCEGGYFKLGEVPQFASADYVDGECSSETLVVGDYGLTPGNAYLGKITIGGSELTDVYVLFEPPDGNVSFNSGAYTGDAQFDFVDDNVQGLSISLTVAESTNQVSLIVNDDE